MLKIFIIFIFVPNMPKSHFYFYFLLFADTGSGKNFAIEKLALNDPSATSRPYKKGGGPPHFSHIPSRACLVVSHPVPEPRSLAVPCLRSSCRARAGALSPVVAAPVHCRALVQPRPAPVPPSPLPPTASPATAEPWSSLSVRAAHCLHSRALH